MADRERTTWIGIGVFVLVIVVLQVYLLAVGLEGLLANEPGQAWSAAALSAVLAAASIGFYVFYRRR